MFLSEKHNGLDILIDYLSTTQFIMRYKLSAVVSIIAVLFRIDISLIFTYDDVLKTT